MEGGLRRWLPVLVVFAGLVFVGVGAAGPGISGTHVPRTREPSDPPPPPEASADPQGQGTAGPGQAQEPADLGFMGAVLDWVLTAAAVGLLAALLGLALYLPLRWLLTERVQRRAVTDRPASQPDGEGAAQTAAQMRDTLRAGLADLDAGGDPRRAVIACWLRLERIAAGAGAGRLAADTPADLVARLLAGHRVDDRALERLADAYRLARYAPSSVDDELVVTARQALREVDAQLAAGVHR